MAMHMLHPGSRHSQPASCEDLVQPLGLGLRLDLLRAGHDEHPHAVGYLAPLEHARGLPQVAQRGRWCNCR